MVEPAGAGDDGLLGRKPSVGGDSFGDQRTGFDVWSLNIDRTHAELLISEQTFETIYPIVLDQQ
jgi:hypothetical protein